MSESACTATAISILLHGAGVPGRPSARGRSWPGPAWGGWVWPSCGARLGRVRGDAPPPACRVCRQVHGGPPARSGCERRLFPASSVQVCSCVPLHHPRVPSVLTVISKDTAPRPVLEFSREIDTRRRFSLFPSGYLTSHGFTLRRGEALFCVALPSLQINFLRRYLFFVANLCRSPPQQGGSRERFCSQDSGRQEKS